jgi:hypothetical protein
MATQSSAISRVSCGVSGASHEQSHANTSQTQPYPTHSNNSTNKALNSSQLLEPSFYSSLKDFNTHLGESKYNYHELRPTLTKPIGLPGRSYMIPMSLPDHDSTLGDIESFTSASGSTDYTTLNDPRWDNTGSYSGTYTTTATDPIQSIFETQEFSDFDLMPNYDTYPSTEPAPSRINPYPILGSADGVTHFDLWDQNFHSVATFDRPFSGFPYPENVSSESPKSIPHRSCECTAE